MGKQLGHKLNEMAAGFGICDREIRYWQTGERVPDDEHYAKILQARRLWVEAYRQLLSSKAQGRRR